MCNPQPSLVRGAPEITLKSGDKCDSYRCMYYIVVPISLIDWIHSLHVFNYSPVSLSNCTNMIGAMHSLGTNVDPLIHRTVAGHTATVRMLR